MSYLLPKNMKAKPIRLWSELMNQKEQDHVPNLIEKKETEKSYKAPSKICRFEVVVEHLNSEKDYY